MSLIEWRLTISTEEFDFYESSLVALQQEAIPSGAAH
jgi:hypothetical protein